MNKGQRLSITRDISKMEMARYPGVFKERMAYDMQSMQRELGSALIAQIWEQGGKSAVQLEFSQYERCEIDALTYALDAYTYPVMRIRNHRVIELPHLEFFPQDWVCTKCGSLMDGLKNPRKCYNCNSPRDITKTARNQTRSMPTWSFQEEYFGKPR